MTDAYWLPIVFIGLMGLSILLYAMLDGYDLGVGILLPRGVERVADRDSMIASVGPYWDANETWLVMAVGLLLIAFPKAHSLILWHLYLPATLMLLGLILRGVAFDFRAKAAVDFQNLWDLAFKLGSALASLMQGYMLGQYVTGFQASPASFVFSSISALGVSAAYCYIGGAWLVMKSEGDLQLRAVRWTRRAGRLCFVGVLAVSVVNPLVNPSVFHRWFDFPLVMLVLVIPTLCFLAFFTNERLLRRLPKPGDRHCAVPFLLVCSIFVLCFTALAFSYFPDIVPGRLTIWEAASAPASLWFILVGVMIVLPVILLYTAFAYRVFHGKSTELKYY